MKILSTIKGVACAVLLGSGLLAAVPAMAVIHNGGEFTVSASQTVSGSDTVTFVYTADFTGWLGGADFIFAVDFGLGGPNIMSVSLDSTTATGTWVASNGPSSANGCGDSSVVQACAEGSSPFQATSGIVTWTFTVVFDSGVTSADWEDSNNHIGAFFCNIGQPGPDCGEQGGGKLGLSEETTFGDGGEDGEDGGDLPEPGTLALLGVGLLGLGLRMRRRKV